MESHFAFLTSPGPLPDAIASGMRAQISQSLRAVPQNICPLLPLLTDSHCHILGVGLTEASLAESMSNELARVGRAKQYLFQTVRVDDWNVIIERACVCGVDDAKIRLGFGVHPRWAQEVLTDGTEFGQKLADCLSKMPSAIVGEIGLDRTNRFKSFFETHQIPIFREQLGIAASFSRPVSIHCVKADAALVQIFQDCTSGNSDGLPPTICLHSFGGSFETLERIISIVEGNHSETHGEKVVRVFVGLNAWTNLYKKGARTFIRRLVLGTPFGGTRMLIESDYDFPDYPGSHPWDADKILLNGVLTLSEMLDWDPAVVALRMEENTRAFLRTLPLDP